LHRGRCIHPTNCTRDRPITRNCRSKWRTPAWDEAGAQTLAGLHPR
jgi:hypothetical protein